MNGYKLSAAAARMEAKRERALQALREPDRKSVIVSGMASRHDGTNFRTNMVTLASYEDASAAVTGNALGLSATWACTNLIAGTIGTLSLPVFFNKDGARIEARNHPLWYVLNESPNFDQTPTDFIEYMAAAVELRGNAFADIARRSDGSVISLTPIPPNIVQVRRNDRTGQLQYTWHDGNRTVTREARDVLHIRGRMGNALGGASVLSVCGRAFSSALAAEGAALSTFANGMRPSGTLETELVLTPEQRTELRRIMDEQFVGSMNAGRPMLLDNGLSWKQIDLTPEDAQMLDSRKFSGEEICRIFGVPPAMVGFGDKSSNWGTGKEVDVLGFLKFTLRPRLKRIEQALAKQLLTPADRVSGIKIKFEMEDLLRGDSQGRADFYQKMTQMGAMTINEVRALENLPPVPGGDVPRLQMQNVPLGSNPASQGNA